MWEVWPAVQRALRYADVAWDLDGDGILEALQHNTYDIEFYGPNPLTGVLYLAALKAAAAMARVLKDEDSAQAYDDLYAAGSEKLDALSFNGEYYVQVEDGPGRKYQFGAGCLSDQLLGQWMVYLSGLGDLLPREHLKSSVLAIYRYNNLSGEARKACVQRLYVDDDEKGLVLCTWPHGGEGRFPFVYCDEVWTGVEYEVAALLIELGAVREGIEIVENVRSRHIAG